MRVLFERTGGFAGRTIRGSLDSSLLAAPKARRLRELLDRSCFFDLPPVLESDQPGADRFHYRITVETEKGKHTVEAGDAAVPRPMRPLLDFLARSLMEK